MSPAESLRALTLEEWTALPDDEPGEWVNGSWEEEETPTILHEFVVAWFAGLFGNWRERHGAVVLGSRFKFVVAADSGRKPDASVYLSGRPLPKLEHCSTKRPPSLVLEVLSPRPRDVRRDMVDKLADYARFGVTYYWIIDPLARTLEVRKLDPAGRHTIVLAVSDGTHDAPGCDGLGIDLTALWAEIDRLTAASED